MSSLRVARIPYLNSVPFYQNVDDGSFDLVDLPPRMLGQAARRGEVDAGIMSLCDSFRSPEFTALGSLGVACDGPAHSVLLFSRLSMDRLSGASVAVTGQTSTSYPLLRLLLEQRYGVDAARYVRREQAADEDDAVLLIGDAALREAASAGLMPGERDYAAGSMSLTAGRWRQVLDLSAAWKRWQGQSFVFARWVVRREAPTAASAELLDRLATSLDQSLRDLRPLAAAHGGQAGLDADAAYAYLMGFTYRLGAPESEAIERFRALLSDSPWWEESTPLQRPETTT
ncbi:MAG TPA: menaquinone biosynthesis protein [Acidobacteriota bacterium]|nr:menaquinone biosynthesis protein [Acidobacteriota bacterium]